METVTLYLASWQKRMIRDFMPSSSYKKKSIKDIDKLVIKPGLIQCLASYKIPQIGAQKGDWVLYLTDEQMTIVRQSIGSRIAIPAINITTDLVKKGNIAFR